MNVSEPTRSRGGSIFFIFVTAVILLVLVLRGVSCSRTSPTSPIVFGQSAVPASTNANLLFVALSNQSDSVVLFLACPLQVRSNGIWSGPPLPPHQRMTQLAAKQSGLIVIDAGSTNENTRVPILWGFYNYNPGAGRWQQLLEDLIGQFSGHGGRGLLYTNYLTDLKL
jgi:hypothetical protein